MTSEAVLPPEEPTVSEEKDTTQKRTWRDAFRRAPGKSRMTPARRRFLGRLGVVVLAILILVVIPGYVALQPKFVQRYANLRPEYQTWSTSVHAQAPCQSCHVAPTPTAQAAYGARMLGEFYLSLVLRSRQPKLFGAPTNAACRSCHIDLRTVSPSGDLNIPHRAHVEVLKLQCIKCHAYLVHASNPEGKHTPRMATCLTCHDGRQAKNGCATCHTNKAIPVSHRAGNWDVIHPQMQAQIDCKQCHAWTVKWCADCHSRRPRSHTADWRTTHGLQVKIHRNCEACHAATFCVRCHGDVPQLNFSPALALVQ